MQDNINSREVDLLRFENRLVHTLLRARTREKALRVSARVAKEFFQADSVCIAEEMPGSLHSRILFNLPKDSEWEHNILRAFLQDQRPQLSRDVIFAPLRAAGAPRTLIGLRMKGEEFDKAAGGLLPRAARLMSQRLEAIQAERILAIRTRIDRSILKELRLRDLLYQILHGIQSLTGYDHSAAFLVMDSRSSSLKVVAERIVWQKAKSDRIGAKLSLTEGLRTLIENGDVVGCDRGERVWRCWGSECAFSVANTFERKEHSGTSSRIHPARAVLYIPVSTNQGFSGLLMLAAQDEGSFGPYEIKLIKDFLPQVQVAIRNSQRNEALQKQLIAAGRKEAVVDLARGVSHDINNAIGTILPLVQQLQHDLEHARLNEKILSEDLDTIENSLQVARRIFHGMLEFARGSTRRPQVVDLTQALDTLIGVLAETLKRQGIQLSLEIDEGLPRVRARHSDLEQVFLNLATNAQEAMPDGGKLTISVHALDEMAEVSFEDTGKGITDSELGRVCEPFYTSKSGSRGLGLAICNSLISDMHGRLEIESKAGVGTKVRVRLPISDS